MRSQPISLAIKVNSADLEPPTVSRYRWQCQSNGIANEPMKGSLLSNVYEEMRVVREAGVEPTTCGFGGRYSIQLSYSRKTTNAPTVFQRNRSGN
ncbi:MAG: hypothetical protein JWM99_4396, partial [Verrucomicrobiales bacterium]|nr:hypothetical protein [Verrucomicrobiales bacterium]